MKKLMIVLVMAVLLSGCQLTAQQTPTPFVLWTPTPGQQTPPTVSVGITPLGGFSPTPSALPTASMPVATTATPNVAVGAFQTLMAPATTPIPGSEGTPTAMVAAIRPEDVVFLGHRNHNPGATGIMDLYHLTSLPRYCPSKEVLDAVGNHDLGYECAAYFYGSFPEQKLRVAMAAVGAKIGHIIINDAGASFLVDAWPGMTAQSVEYFHVLLGGWAEVNIVGLCKKGTETLGTMALDGSDWTGSVFVKPVFIQIYPPGAYDFERTKDNVVCPN